MKKDVVLYKLKKEELEKKLGRSLTKEEGAKLYNDIISDFITAVKIPKEKIDNLEIAGYKD